jgi:hypothetical protein
MEVAAEDVQGLARYGGCVDADGAEIGGFVGVALLGDGDVGLDHVQAGDQLKVSDVRRSHSVAKFEGTHPYQQIRKRDADTFGPALAVDLSGTKGDRNRYRLDGYTHEQLVKEALSSLAALGCVGASNAVG